AYPEADQHHGHAELEHVGPSAGKLAAPGEQERANDEQRDGVPESPAGADERSSPSLRVIRDDRRNGREVIGVERVPQPDEKPQPPTGQQRDHRERHGSKPAATRLPKRKLPDHAASMKCSSAARSPLGG